MPFFANTPESRVSRTDSKNPSTTCRGITSSGRPCRRPVAGNASPTPPSRLKAANLRVDDPSDESLYCWQHKEQASISAHSSPGPKTSHTPILEERTSIDTLADRLGLIGPTKSEKGSKHDGSPGKQRPTKMARPKPKQQKLHFCCFSIPIEEVSPPPRPKPHPIQPTVFTPQKTSRPPNQYLPTGSPSRPRPIHSSPSGRRPSITGQYMALIPTSASPQTASLLLAELAKPVSQQDEAGYIYIFWLTSESQPSTPPAEAARSLLSPSTPMRPSNGRRVSDVLVDFGSIVDSPRNRSVVGGGGKKKILLKIGRATNVQRRLNEWQRQCGYNLSLIRYYPYVPSGSPATEPRKIPHSHKVERLVHIELQGRGMRVADREKCSACGREHREWFEVDAKRNAVAEVDEVVRRWSDWNEAQA